MASIDEEVKTRFMNDKQKFVTNLVFTSGWIYNLFTEYLRPFQISSQQFNILRILRGADKWVSMSDVKSLMVEKAPNTTRLVDKMLDKHLLERERSGSDRRVVFVRITAQGLALLTKIDNTPNQTRMDFMNRITEKEAIQMSKILDKLRG